MFATLFTMFLSTAVHAAPQSLSYQGRILDSSQNPLESPSVIFQFTLLSPDETCELWTETKSAINMTGSGGIFDITIGPSAGLASALENGTAHTCLNSGNYTGAATASRKLKVAFNAGGGFREITPHLDINAVPYASVAAKLGNRTAADFIARPGTCLAGQSVYFDGANFVCQAIAAGDVPDIDASIITTGTITRDILSTNVSATNGQFTNLRIYDGTSQYLTMNYPAAGALSYTIRWPVTQGGASTVLQNDGAGNLSWAAAGGGGGTQLQGRAVSATLPLDGQALVWDNGGTTWRPEYIRAQDLRNAWGGSQMIPSTACTAAQSMTWSVITDAFTCQTIALDAAAITGGVINPARLGTGTADSTTFLRGDGTWQVASGSGDIEQNGNSFNAAMTIGTNDLFNLNFETNDTARMTVDTDGRVGIGITNPANRLQVVETHSSTTASMKILNQVTLQANGAVASGTDSAIGQRINVTRSNQTGGTINTYGQMISVASPGSAGSTDSLFGQYIDLNPTGAVGSLQPEFGYGSYVNSLLMEDQGSYYGYYSSLRQGASGSTAYGFYADTTSAGASNVQAYGYYAAVSSGSFGGFGYGLYIDGTQGNAGSMHGAFVNVTNGSRATNYSGVFLGGNFGIGVPAPTTVLDIGGALTQRGTVAPPVSASGQGRIYFSSAENKFKISQNGGAYTDLVSTATGNILNDGNSFSNEVTLGTNDSFALNFETNDTTRMTVLPNGNVGIGTSSPTAALEVNGTFVGKASVDNLTLTVDFGIGNLHHTNNDCGNFILHNMKDGASYMFIVKGTVSSLCTFSAFLDAGLTPLSVKLPPGHASTTAGKHTIYNFVVSATDVYVSWIPGY